MLKKIFLFISILSSFLIVGQNEFRLKSNTNKLKIPFKQVNNLLFIEVVVNDKPLTFLLDTGVTQTILFSLEETDQVKFFNVEKTMLKGLGKENAITALRSKGNTLKISDKFIDTNHEVLIVLEEDVNFSSMVGIPVNGVLGYHFFKDFLIEIDYDRNVLYVHKNNEKFKKIIDKNYKAFPISIEERKPYLQASLVLSDSTLSAKLLVDVGNSDALWLFENYAIRLQEPNFEDFLGRGFSGDIFGKRTRISKLALADFVLENPIVAFPDSISIKNVKLVPERVGSIGAEIWRRFNLVFDYGSSMLYLKKNSNYGDVFSFNMSGLEIHHVGKQWIQKPVENNSSKISFHSSDTSTPRAASMALEFKLISVYRIANVRVNSPAALAGLQKDDILVSINKKPAYMFSLQNINALLKSREGKLLKFEVERKGQIIKTEFVMKKIL
ncbi:retropepsin-like aspartic protease [Flavobacterium sp. UBA6135]|uniref:retropepsin-like aspartic protease n=1 Tax=Flavobacterium sp. UBA6135 TaxID=1946553 RepID=UPI0025C6C31F|nr:PDZ domain-containing protein [Flavobacterium sp. UBA6135]